MYLLKIIITMLTVVFIMSSCTKVKENDHTSNLKVTNKTKINEKSSIIVYGDTRNGYEVHKKIVKNFLEKNPTMIFNTGDLVYDGDNINLWPTFYDIIKPILKTARYYPVLGNHERNSINYFKLFELPNNEKWYHVDFKNIRFFMLDSTSDLSVNSKQYNWLETQLKASKQHHKALIFHHPLFSVGRHGSEVHLRKKLGELIKKYNVKMVFNGHDHAYQRFMKDEVHYIVTGGGGAPLYDKKDGSDDEKYLKKYIKAYHYCLLNTSKKELFLEVYSLNNKLIDSIIIK